MGGEPGTVHLSHAPLSHLRVKLSPDSHAVDPRHVLGRWESVKDSRPLLSAAGRAVRHPRQQQCIEQIKNVSSIAMLAMRDPGVATSAR